MILYQFKKINKHTLENIKEKKIWISSPSKFNDPFDTIIRIGCELDEIIYKLCIDFYNEYHNDGEKFEYDSCLCLFISNRKEGKAIYPPFSESISFGLQGKHGLQVPLMNKIKDKIGDNCFAINTFLAIYSDIGISCFTKSWFEPVMWAHYADGHKGICIKYEIDEAQLSPVLELIKVSYEKSLPGYKHVDARCGLDAETLKRDIGNKSDVWSYESEYRLINKKGSNHSIPIPGKIISIATGLRTTEVDKKRLLDSIENDSEILLGSVSKSHDYRKLDWFCARPGSSKIEMIYYTPKN